MNLRYRTLLFDLDGTLLDSIQDIEDSLAHAMGCCGIAIEGETRALIDGATLLEIFERLRPEGTESERERFRLAYRDHYRANTPGHSQIYPGITTCLESLANHHPTIALAVVTNKPTAVAVRLLKHFQLSRYFQSVLGSGDSALPPKPDPSIVYRSLNELGVPPTNGVACLLIGDTAKDLLAARAAGIDSAAALWGYGGNAEITALNPTHELHRPEDLLSVLTE